MLQLLLIAAIVVPSAINAIVDDGLPNLQRYSAFHEQQHSVICMAQAFTSVESTKVFGIDLIKKGIRPLLLILENRSTASITLLASDINNLELIPPKRVIDELQYNMPAFTAATGLPALLYFWELCLPVGALAYEFYRHNRWVDDLISENALAPITTLGPLQTAKRLIFVADNSDFNQFTIRMHDNRTGDSFVFEVNLKLARRKSTK